MGRPLFGMSDAELDYEYQKYTDRLYERYFESGDDECCENCDHWLSGECFRHEDDDGNNKETAPDDYCDEYEPKDYSREEDY